MTGDIKSKLASSEAAESLNMEHLVATCFHARKWPAEQGVYYADPETGKDREIDVISRHHLERPRRYRGSGAPIINLSIICECKSLSGWNVLLRKGELDWHENRLPGHWAGYENYITELIEKVTIAAAFKNCDKSLLYSYFLRRAYPDNKELSYELRLLQRPVDLIAAAFRPTKDGSQGRETNNPLWSAIQSVLSSTKAAERRAVEVMRSYTSDINPVALTPDKLIKSLAFFFDAELTRRAFVHPVIFCKSRLFNMDDNFKEINSARIIVRDLDFNSRYIDIVNFSSAEAYINNTLASFEKQSCRLIRRTWNRLEELRWAPG